MTVENLESVMFLVKPDNRRQVWEALFVPPARLDATERSFRTRIDNQTASISIYYVDCHPNATWYNIVGNLYKKGEMDALKKSLTFLSPKDSHKGSYYTCVYIE